MDVLQKQLTRVIILWNQHRLQLKGNHESPGWKPDIFFFVPDAYGTRDNKVECDQNDMLYCPEL